MPTPRRFTATVVSSPTPLRTPTHHKSADELALIEAEQILHSGIAAANADEDDDANVGASVLLSPRAKRHARLTALRDISLEPFSLPSEELNASCHALLTARLGGKQGEAEPETTSSGSKSNSEGDESETDDTDDDNEGNDTEDSDDVDDNSEDELDRLLEAAKTTALRVAESTSTPASTEQGETLDGEMELKFDEENAKEAPIPDISIPTLPRQYLTLAKDGTARAARTDEAGPSKWKSSNVPELDREAYERTLSKREKAAQPKKATVSEAWAAMPATRAEDIVQMKRDYQALALANTLDPKRFMKGGNRAGKVPERFAIGTMVDAPRHLQETTVGKERKYRAGQVVSGLIEDAGIGSYAKRKYEELQSTRMFNGRGKGWKKRSKW